MTAPTAGLLLHRFRLRARRRVLWMEEQWSRGRASPDQGLAITAGEVGRVLETPEEAAANAASFAARHAVAALQGPIAAAGRALAEDPGWQSLCENFALSQAERDLLALTVAEALEPQFGRVIAYLNDDARQQKATPLLAAVLFEEGPAAPFLPDALLNWRLALPLHGQPPGLAATEYQADPAVLAYLTSGVWTDPQLRGIVAVHDAAKTVLLPMLFPDALEEVRRAGEASGPLCVDLLGAEGSGRRVFAAQFAAAAGRALLVVDGQALAALPATDQPLVACLRLARATNAIMLFRHGELLPPLPAQLAAGLDLWRALPAEAITRTQAIAITLEKPTLATRLLVWEQHSAAPPPPIVASQRLTPGEIALVAAAAPGGAGAIRLALRRTAPPEGDILSRLPCPYEWDDLVLPEDMRAQLRELVAQIRLRWEVYEEWGFGKLAHLGTGIAALFAGPSGTGKTMAAQVLARALDLDLYRVDLAGVINKYVGETEKRLRDVFAFGERAGVVLFFDEADALFGSRMQVKDSHDRFANIEIDYLLQRIERFDGIAILATNRKGDVDTAFLRRLRFVVDFIPPGPPERLAIWRKALPEATPAGAPLLDGINWNLLAGQLTLTGADIKSAALSAAFLARGEESLINMRHVLAAVQREMAKRGQVLRLRPAEATGT